MYIDKQVKRGYNEYIRLDEGIGKDAMMDVALLVMEDGDTYSFEEPEKELLRSYSTASAPSNGTTRPTT